MKKFILLFLTIPICIFSSLSVKSVIAQSQYLRVIDQTTPLFSDELGQNLLFYLPYTYYVRVLDEKGDFLHVLYLNSGKSPSIDGFVNKNALFDDGLPVLNPYPEIKIKTASTAVLYKDANLSIPLQYVFPDREMVFYGYGNLSGKRVYCVSYNNLLGYISENDLIPFEIENHPNELTFIKKEETSPAFNEITEEKGKGNTKTLKILITSCIAFAGIIALFIVLRVKPKERYNYYDENDYE